MNKTELITFLRDPSKLTKNQLEELDAVVKEHPYFLSARLLLAKASKEQGHPETKKRISSAAIYSTDRVLLKKYLNGNLFFLSEPPKPQEEAPIQKEKLTTPQETGSKEVTGEKKKAPTDSEKSVQKDLPLKDRSTKPQAGTSISKEKTQKAELRSDTRPSALKSKEEKPLPSIPEVPSGELDSILEELQRDMENLKASRSKFADVQQKIEEDDAVSEALKKASTSKDTKASKEIEPDDFQEVKDESKTVNEDSNVEEAKKSATEITMQILDAARKAKEEVAREDAEKKEQDVNEDDLETEEKPEIGQEKSTDQDAGQSDKEQDENSTEDTGRAERVIREPRFSRFATRSYLTPPEEIDPTKYLDEDKKKEKPKNIDESEKEENSSKDKEENSSKIKLPDLSKAKPVARRSKRKTKKEDKEDSTEVSTKRTSEKKVESKEAKTSKTTESAKTKATTKKDDDKKVESKKPLKKTTVKAPKKSDTETKSSTKKESPTKKSATTKAKPVPKPKAKKAAEKKPVTKKATTKKAPAKEATKKTAKPRAASKSKSSSTKKEDKKDDGKGEQKSQKQIIDKFIKESPSIKYQRKESRSEEDLAEQSSAWDPNLASEYLAEIYLHQGNKKRAIEIYEALSLKYPEKKSYFADLISKIE